MHRIKIKPNERKGPVRVEVALQNTSRGQVQRFKYFSSPEKTSLEARAENIAEDNDATPAYAEPVDQMEHTIPLHKRTTGKVRNNLFHVAGSSKKC